MESKSTHGICRGNLRSYGLDFQQGLSGVGLRLSLNQVPSRLHASCFKCSCCLLRNISQLERLTSPIHAEPFDTLWISRSNSLTWPSSDVKLQRLNLIFSSIPWSSNERLRRTRP